jgi:hypothetical protein
MRTPVAVTDELFGRIQEHSVMNGPSGRTDGRRSAPLGVRGPPRCWATC